jgi:hypothetical protein
MSVVRDHDSTNSRCDLIGYIEGSDKCYDELHHSSLFVLWSGRDLLTDREADLLAGLQENLMRKVIPVIENLRGKPDSVSFWNGCRVAYDPSLGSIALQ